MRVDSLARAATKVLGLARKCSELLRSAPSSSRGSCACAPAPRAPTDPTAGGPPPPPMGSTW
eukprot:875123-Alexandrium_andersonii.AAC.1